MKYLIAICICLAGARACAQDAPSRPAYPQDYFRNPLDIPIFLAGNFGECRPGHFHSGTDIKTLGRENQPVHAAADGYISRIKMEKGGFGHGLYITHPGGYTTLYAHLNDFTPAIQQYVRGQQYAKKRWDVDLQLSPSQFPVKKGQQVAWSGNTGASTAPHLHFEIRDGKTEHPLNPELFGLPVADKLPPVMREAVFYTGNVYEDRNITATLAKKGDTYSAVKTDNAAYPANKDTVTLPAGLTGIGINADDYMGGSDNTIAFYTAQLYVDDSLQATIQLDNIGYDETRYINAYTDYKTRQQKHKWVQLLYQLPGNRLDGIYTYLNSNRGKVYIAPGSVHKVAITLTDDRDNQSTAIMYVKPAGPAAAMPAPEGSMLWQAGKANTFSNANVSFTLDERQLYDDIHFVYKAIPDARGYSDRYQLHYAYVPVHHSFELQLKPSRPVPFDLRSKMAIMYSDGTETNGTGAAATDDGWYKAGTRNLGTYWLDADTIPPVIKPMQKDGANLSKAKQITFEVKDAMTSVSSYSGYIDGEWVCFEAHASLVFYKFDTHCPKGKHELVFKATDENGNSKTVKMTFTR